MNAMQSGPFHKEDHYLVQGVRGLVDNIRLPNPRLSSPHSSVAIRHFTITEVTSPNGAVRALPLKKPPPASSGPCFDVTRELERSLLPNS